MGYIFFFLVTVPCAAYAALQVVTSAESRVNKVVWCLVILMLPLIGFMLWYIAGPRTKQQAKKP